MRDRKIGRIYEDGEVIFSEGDEGDSMYVIQEGTIKIVRRTESGEATIAQLESGDIFGEMALFDRLPRSATAVAAEESRVLSIDKEKLFSTASQDPTIVFKIIASMSGRIRNLDDRLTTIAEENDLFLVAQDVESTCERVIDALASAIPADGIAIILFNEDRQTSQLLASLGTAPDPAWLGQESGPAQAALEGSNGELIASVADDPRYSAFAQKYKSLLWTPLKKIGEVFGLIFAGRTANTIFNAEHLKIITALGEVASIAINNAMIITHIVSTTKKAVNDLAIAKLE